MSNGIETSHHDGVLVVTFARPEIRSPLSVSVLSELEKIVADCARNVSLKALVFTGKNDVFASGADLREIAELTAATAPDFARRGQNLMSSIANLPQTTVAAINGFCFGGALDLALACDKRIASPDAKFCHPGAGLGIITGWSGTQRLPRLIGTANANEMFFTASPIDAERAIEIGLIDEITDDVFARALELSR
jgi:enoyl-CoA hydratase